MRQPAIFLDRDGTLNEEVGYLRSIDQFRLYSFTAQAIRRINDAGWLAIVITNQSGVARGYLTEPFLHQLHARMREELSVEAGARIDEFYYCPHLPPGLLSSGETKPSPACDCRKPKPGMLHRAAAEWPIDLSQSYMIGDRYGDLAAGFAAGTEGILVRTGYGEEEIQRDQAAWDRPPGLIAANLLDAVEWVLASSTKETV